MSEEIFRLSLSKTKTFLDCAKKYNYSYNLKLPQKEFIHHAFGKFCHKVLEDFHNYYISGGLEPYNVVMSRVYKNAIVDYKDKLSNDLKHDCWEIINSYLKKISSEPKFNVLACEKDFKLNLNENVMLNGAIDRIQLDDDNVLHIADYKTTKDKKYLKNDYFQLLTYAFVLWHQDNSIEKVRGSYILLRHNFEYVTFEFNQEQIKAVAQQYIDYANKILIENEFKANPTRLCEYCSYLDLCDEGKSKVSPQKIFGEIKW